MNLADYTTFIQKITSEESKDTNTFLAKTKELQESSDVNIALLLTAAVGLSAESGEFMEIPKKILFQSKPLDEATQFHLKRELGDILFYWVSACKALNISPDDVIVENVSKLSSRYPDGEFNANCSENSKAGDI